MPLPFPVPVDWSRNTVWTTVEDAAEATPRVVGLQGDLREQKHLTSLGPPASGRLCKREVNFQLV